MQKVLSSIFLKTDFVHSADEIKYRQWPVDEIEDGKQCLPNSAILSRKSNEEISFTLSWSHYLILMRIENPEARSFYEIECTQQQWSVRQLSRQVGSSLYERLALSRDKDKVMRLQKNFQTMFLSSAMELTHT